MDTTVHTFSVRECQDQDLSSLLNSTDICLTAGFFNATSIRSCPNPMQDTEPPQLSFEGQLPLPSSASSTANISFQATDASGVALVCRVSSKLAPGGNDTFMALQEHAPSLHTPLTLGQEMACNSSMTLYWLLPGRPDDFEGRFVGLSSPDWALRSKL